MILHRDLKTPQGVERETAEERKTLSILVELKAFSLLFELGAPYFPSSWGLAAMLLSLGAGPPIGLWLRSS